MKNNNPSIIHFIVDYIHVVSMMSKAGKQIPSLGKNTPVDKRNWKPIPWLRKKSLENSALYFPLLQRKELRRLSGYLSVNIFTCKKQQFPWKCTVLTIKSSIKLFQQHHLPVTIRRDYNQDCPWENQMTLFFKHIKKAIFQYLKFINLINESSKIILVTWGQDLNLSPSGKTYLHFRERINSSSIISINCEGEKISSTHNKAINTPLLA